MFQVHSEPLMHCPLDLAHIIVKERALALNVNDRRRNMPTYKTLQVQSFQRRMVNHMVSASLTPSQSHKGLLSRWVFSGMFPLPKLIRSQGCKVVSSFPSSSIRHPSRNLILRIEVNSDKPSPRIGWSRGSLSLAKLCRVVRGSGSPICFI